MDLDLALCGGAGPVADITEALVGLLTCPGCLGPRGKRRKPVPLGRSQTRLGGRKQTQKQTVPRLPGSPTERYGAEGRIDRQDSFETA